ncbi:MAG: hypothetical protein LBP76_06610 [Treponema sp.]|jgi:hypothetical protein|nr:hypothetical protein [Treponema sp.]
MKEYHKCGNGVFCNTLDKRIKYPGSGGYGLFSFLVLRYDEGMMERCIGVIYKETAKDRGIALNYCPFCGEKIDWFREEEGYEKGD